MRRALLAVTAIAVLGAAGCATTAVSATGSRQPVSPVPSTASSSAAAVAVTGAQPPTVTPFQAAPPTSYSGPGDKYGVTLPITKPAGATTVVATITGGSPGTYFAVRGLDGAKEDLVGTTGSYRGATLLDAGGTTTTTRLYVYSRGPWSITLSDPRSAPNFTTSYSGTGDTVVVYQGGGGTASVTGGAAGTRFQILGYGAGSVAGYLTNGVAPFTGSFHWPSGVGILVVRAVGPWTISIQ